MIEMAAYLKQELSEKTGTQLKTKFNPVSKWQRKATGAHTELIIYEDREASNSYFIFNKEDVLKVRIISYFV